MLDDTAVKKLRLLMNLLKEIKSNSTIVFKSSIGAITKILFSIPFLPQLYSSCTSFLNFLIRYLLFDMPFLLLSPLSTGINSTLHPLSFEIDSCCHGSDFVTKRKSCQLKFSGSDCVKKRNSCQLKFLIVPTITV